MDALLTKTTRRLHDGPKGTTMQVISENADSPLFFRCLVAKADPYTFQGDLDPDSREGLKMDVFNERVPECLKAPDAKRTVKIQGISGTCQGKTFQVLDRDDNAADFITTFRIQQEM